MNVEDEASQYASIEKNVEPVNHGLRRSDTLKTVLENPFLNQSSRDSVARHSLLYRPEEDSYDAPRKERYSWTGRICPKKRLAIPTRTSEDFLAALRKFLYRAQSQGQAHAATEWPLQAQQLSVSATFQCPNAFQLDTASGSASSSIYS